MDYRERCFPLVNAKSSFEAKPCKLYLSPGHLLSQPSHNIDCCTFVSGVGAVPPTFLQAYTYKSTDQLAPDFYGNQVSCDYWEGAPKDSSTGPSGTTTRRTQAGATTLFSKMARLALRGDGDGLQFSRRMMRFLSYQVASKSARKMLQAAIGGRACSSDKSCSALLQERALRDAHVTEKQMSLCSQPHSYISLSANAYHCPDNLSHAARQRPRLLPARLSQT